VFQIAACSKVAIGSFEGQARLKSEFCRRSALLALYRSSWLWRRTYFLAGALLFGPARPCVLPSTRLSRGGSTYGGGNSSRASALGRIGAIGGTFSVAELIDFDLCVHKGYSNDEAPPRINRMAPLIIVFPGGGIRGLGGGVRGLGRSLRVATALPFGQFAASVSHLVTLFALVLAIYILFRVRY